MINTNDIKRLAIKNAINLLLQKSTAETFSKQKVPLNKSLKSISKTIFERSLLFMKCTLICIQVI